MRFTWARYSKVSWAITSMKGHTEVLGSSAMGSRRGGSQLTLTLKDESVNLYTIIVFGKILIEVIDIYFKTISVISIDQRISVYLDM